MSIDSVEYPSAVELIRCIISKPNDLAATRVSVDANSIINFDFRENLYAPFVGGTLTISDSSNFVNDYPISGGENIEMVVKSSFSDEEIVHKLVVNNVEARILPDDKKQLYVLKLVSKELMINEQCKVEKKLKGKIDEIINDLLRNYLNTSKEFFSEKSKNKITKVPSETDYRPFDIISEIITKFIPDVGKEKKDRIKNFNKKASNKNKIGGTAGAFFWETRRGYNLFTADALCDIDPEGKFAKGKLVMGVHGPYIEQTANLDPAIPIDPRFNIKTIFFPIEVDVMKSLRSGKYSTKVIIFNLSTQEYEEVIYTLSDSWNDMAHLGNQNSYDSIDFNPAGQLVGFDTTSEITRDMSFVIDHEAFFNEPQIANPEDNSEPENPTDSPELHKYFAAQSSARFDLLTNQQCVMKIHGNPFICAGDRVKIVLQAKVPDAVSKTVAIDIEGSGVYLVKEITHNYIFSEGTSGICETTLRLMRDAYGMEISPSAHGT